MICARINKILVPLAAIMSIIAVVLVMTPSPPVVNPDARPARQLNQLQHYMRPLEKPSYRLTTMEKPANGGIIIEG